MAHRALKPELDIRGLTVFLAVLDAGSMTVASRHLGMTQSAVSQAVARLEDELQVPLLDRSTRPFSATEAGVVLVERGRRILADASGVVSELRRLAVSHRPRLKLGLIDSVAGTIGAALIRGIRSEVREVSVWSGISPVLRQDVAQGRLDLVITTDPTIFHSGLGGRLLREPLIAVVPANTPHIDERPVDPMRLSELLPLVRYSERSVIGAEIEALLRDRSQVPPRVFEFDGSDGVFTMVSEGLGWAITTPLCLLHGRKFGENVVVRPLTGKLAYREIHLLAANALGEDFFERIAETSTKLLEKRVRESSELIAPINEDQFVFG